MNDLGPHRQVSVNKNTEFAHASDRRHEVRANSQQMGGQLTVDGLKRTTVLPSWMHLVEVDWNASNQRRKRHNQQHVSIDP